MTLLLREIDQERTRRATASEVSRLALRSVAVHANTLPPYGMQCLCSCVADATRTPASAEQRVRDADGGPAGDEPGVVEPGLPQQHQRDHGDGGGQRVDDRGPAEVVGHPGHERERGGVEAVEQGGGPLAGAKL